MRPSSGGRWKVPKRGGSCGSWLQSKFEDRVSRTIERRQPRVHEAAGRMKSQRRTILRLALGSHENIVKILQTVFASGFSGNHMLAVQIPVPQMSPS